MSAPNFAGGSTRRKGNRQRRAFAQGRNMKPRSRRSFDVDAAGSSGLEASLQSFGMSGLGLEGSLLSFSGMNSFSTSIVAGGGDKNINVQVGNLVFASDAEMSEIMYGDDQRRPAATSTSSLAASLPPSATLGTGSFSTVRLAWRKTPNDKHKNETSKGTLVAVKILQKSILKQMKTYQKGSNKRLTVLTAFDKIEREIATMKRLKHPNLVRLFEVIDSVEFERLHMVLEYVSLGEILSHVEGTNKYTRTRYRAKVRGLTKDGHFDEKHAALYFVDIMHGLAYLHRHRICHRDLKPENILLSTSGIAKIADFGVAHMFEEEKRHQSFMPSASSLDDSVLDEIISDSEGDSEGDYGTGKSHDELESATYLSKRESDSALKMSSKHSLGYLKKSEGTWCFWSPEMCRVEKTGFSGYASDLWAAGVCLYIFTTSLLPFFSLIPSDLFDIIQEANVPYEGLDLSNELKDLLGKLLEKDPATRAGVGDCLQHEFCAEARVERVRELGSEFRGSEEFVIVSQTDVDSAFSTIEPANPHRRLSQIQEKRFSALASTMTGYTFD